MFCVLFGSRDFALWSPTPGVGHRYGHGDEAIDQETEMDESSHNESSHSFGSASTLAKSADANGFYGFLRPSEELS